MTLEAKAYYFTDNNTYPDHMEFLWKNRSLEENIPVDTIVMEGWIPVITLNIQNISDETKTNLDKIMKIYDKNITTTDDWKIKVTWWENKDNHINYSISWVFEGDVPKKDPETGEELRAHGINITIEDISENKQVRTKTDPLDLL